jgi:hypothetical protein
MINIVVSPAYRQAGSLHRHTIVHLSLTLVPSPKERETKHQLSFLPLELSISTLNSLFVFYYAIDYKLDFTFFLWQSFT